MPVANQGRRRNERCESIFLHLSRRSHGRRHSIHLCQQPAPACAAILRLFAFCAIVAVAESRLLLSRAERSQTRQTTCPTYQLTQSQHNRHRSRDGRLLRLIPSETLARSVLIESDRIDTHLVDCHMTSWPCVRVTLLEFSLDYLDRHPTSIRGTQCLDEARRIETSS